MFILIFILNVTDIGINSGIGRVRNIGIKGVRLLINRHKKGTHL